MSKKIYVKFEIPEKIVDSSLQLLEMARKTGKVKAGCNEVTKAIERGSAKLVYIAEDVQPPEVVMHLPVLCEEKKIPYIYIPNKKKLGAVSGLQVPSSAVAIVNPGDTKRNLETLKEKIAELIK